MSSNPLILKIVIIVCVVILCILAALIVLEFRRLYDLPSLNANKDTLVSNSNKPVVLDGCPFIASPCPQYETNSSVEGLVGVGYFVPALTQIVSVIPGNISYEIGNSPPGAPTLVTATLESEDRSFKIMYYFMGSTLNKTSGRVGMKETIGMVTTNERLINAAFNVMIAGKRGNDGNLVPISFRY